MINCLGKEIKVGDLNINDELLTHYVRYKDEVLPVSDEWERNGVLFVSDSIGYPIKVTETEPFYNGVLSGKEVLQLMQHLASKGNDFFRDTLIQFNMMDTETQADKLQWLDSLEIGKNQYMSAETELLLMQFDAD